MTIQKITLYLFKRNQEMTKQNDEAIRESVREAYGEVATVSGVGGCCGSGCCGAPPSANAAAQTSLALGYNPQDVAGIPEGANMGLGCGNPQAIAALKAGETVLDLGCGGGFDCFLAARKVGPTGSVIGVDMTPQMVSKARKNVAEAGEERIDIRLGEIENIPVADQSVDVIISNCVINLSPNKGRVWAEAYRVLKRGGRVAVSDVVASSPLPQAVREDMALHAGCIAGASTPQEIEQMLAQAGFSEIRIELKEESRLFIKDWVPGSGAENYVVSATIEAVKS
jgi:SAM-dependent methyltransferase